MSEKNEISKKLLQIVSEVVKYVDETDLQKENNKKDDK